MGAQRYSRRSLVRELVLVAVAFVFCIPFYLLVAISLETTPESYKTPMSFPIPPHPGNFSIVWGTKGQAGLGHPLESSLIITALSVIGVILFGSIAAFAIARHRGKLSDGLYIAFVIGIILPFQLAIIPLFVAYHDLSLIGRTTAEIAYYAGFVTLNIGLLMPVTVFLYTGFIRALPRDYEEAAWVDGAGVIRTYARVVFPLLLPITGTVAVIVGVAVWNEFFLALLFLNNSRIETLPIALADYVGQTAAWNLIFAGVAIAVAPILLVYLFAQRHLIKTFTAGVKG